MLTKNSSNLLPFSFSQLPALYFSLILFGQVFFSLIAGFLNVENRIVMLALRFLIMTLSLGFIFINLRRKQIGYFFNPWVVSVILFWLLYLARLFFDVHVDGVILALPEWELLAWSLGSSLPIAICTYLYSAQSSLNFILSDVVRYGVYMLGASIIIFLINPGIQQGAFYLQDLNPITSGNAGCALFLLCFSRVLLKKITKSDFNVPTSITFLGIAIGLFIAFFSATRGVIMAIGLIVLVTIFYLRSYLHLYFFYSRKFIVAFAASLLLVGLSASLSTRLIGKLFTAHAPVTIMIRLEMWQQSLSEFFHNPLLGVGFQMHEIIGSLNLEEGLHYPHNYLLESLAIGGILLTIPLVYCILTPAINFHKKYKAEYCVLPICLLTGQVFIYSMHNGHLGDFPFFWMMISAMAGTKYRLHQISN